MAALLPAAFPRVGGNGGESETLSTQVFSGRSRSAPCQPEGAARSLSKAVSAGWSHCVLYLWAQGQSPGLETPPPCLAVPL